MGRFQRRLVKGVLWVVAHPKSTLAGSAALLVVCIVCAAHWLTISTDQNNLFSPKVKFFNDYLQFDREFPENQAIYVVIEPANPREQPGVGEWVAIADRIASRLRGMPEAVRLVVDRIPLEHPGAPGILFQDPKLVPENVRQMKEQLVPLAEFWGQRPSFVAGLVSRTPIGLFFAGLSTRDPDDQMLQFVRALADGLARQAEHPEIGPQIGNQVPDLAAVGADDPEPLGYLYVPDADPRDPAHHLLLIRVYEVENQSGLTTQAQTIDRIRRAVMEEARAFPKFKAGLTGRPVLDADEDRTTDRDSKRAEVIALAVVFIGLVLLLRSIWLAIVAELSLAVAIGWTFGWATLTVRQLNLLSTVFLIALIGIGMDYLIQILAAYRREARRYVRPGAIWARVFRYVGPPVNTACLGAAGAFLVSVFTNFRGAAELGIIAGGGLLLCLLAGHTVLPALLVLFPARIKPYPASKRYGAAPPRTARRLALPLVWLVLLIAGIPLMMRADFNPNLLDLQAPNLESVQLIRKIQDWNAVVLSRDLNMLRKVRDAVQGAPTVANTDSILRATDNNAWLRQNASGMSKIDWTAPARIEARDLPDIAAKARGLANHLTSEPAPSTSTAESDARAGARFLRAFAGALTAPSSDRARMASALSQWQDAFVAELRRLMEMMDPPPLKIENIPPELRDHLASTIDQPPGQYVYALYIEPKEDLWQREQLRAFVRDVEAHVATVPGAPPVTGIAPDIYQSTHAIETAFYQATAYALALIFALVLIDLRNVTHTLIAVSVLALGLPMLVALMGMLHVSWNFANFFGLPILIGAGHEYGVFLMHRYREALHDPRRVWRRWDPSDRALLLCAFVTCGSFGFFWAMSSHLGLRSLGLVMALGTLCIYLSAILVVRSLLTWRLELRRNKAERK